MKRHATVTAAALAMIFVAALLASSVLADKKEEQPVFWVHKTLAEMGKYYEGADIAYTFKVRNNGRAELHINSVRPG